MESILIPILKKTLMVTFDKTEFKEGVSKVDEQPYEFIHVVGVLDGEAYSESRNMILSYPCGAIVYVGPESIDYKDMSKNIGEITTIASKVTSILLSLINIEKYDAKMTALINGYVAEYVMSVIQKFVKEEKKK